MPYIKQNKRDKINIAEGIYIGGIDYTAIDCAGDIQYAIAVIIQDYIKRKGRQYQTYNDIMGALAGAQMEAYRQQIAPYEDEKIKENGNV